MECFLLRLDSLKTNQVDTARPGVQQGAFFTFSGNQVSNLHLGAKKILLYEASWLGWKITVGINSHRCHKT